MSIIDIVLADRSDEVGPFPEFVELERSDTHASIRTSTDDTMEEPTGYRRVHIGLQDLIDNAPVVSYHELPEAGVVITKFGSIVAFERYKPGDYDFLMLHEPLRLLHTGYLALEF